MKESEEEKTSIERCISVFAVVTIGLFLQGFMKNLRNCAPEKLDPGTLPTSPYLLLGEGHPVG